MQRYKEGVGYWELTGWSSPKEERDDRGRFRATFRALLGMAIFIRSSHPHPIFCQRFQSASFSSVSFRLRTGLVQLSVVGPEVETTTTTTTTTSTAVRHSRLERAPSDDHVDDPYLVPRGLPDRSYFLTRPSYFPLATGKSKRLGADCRGSVSDRPLPESR